MLILSNQEPPSKGETQCVVHIKRKVGSTSGEKEKKKRVVYMEGSTSGEKEKKKERCMGSTI